MDKVKNPKGAGRKKNLIKRKAHMLSFTDEDWELLQRLAQGERKVADFIVKLAKEYDEANK